MSDYLTERFMRLPDGTLPHMGVAGGGDVAPYVLLSGDPGRVEKMKTRLDEAEAVGKKRGYLVYTGIYRGAPVTLATSGVGAPSAAIAMEELAEAGGSTFIRVGSCASIAEQVAIGDVIIGTAGVRDEGLSHTYAPAIYPAVADPDVVAALRGAAEAEGTAYHLGLVRSTDSFYEGERKVEIIDQWRALRVLAFEMESSALFTVATVRGLGSGSILVPGANLVTGHRSTYQGQHVQEYSAGTDAAITIALDAVVRLHAASQQGD